MSATEAVRPIRVPIARYEVDEGARMLVAVGRRSVRGEVAIDQIVDRPESGSGRSYLVESNIQPGDHLRSLVADYTRQAADLGHPPDECRGARGRYWPAVAASGRRSHERAALHPHRRDPAGVQLPVCDWEKVRRYAPELIAGGSRRKRW